MIRILLVVILALSPLIARAEENEKKEEVVVTVSVDKESGQVKVTIDKGKEEPVSNERHSRRRGK